MSDAATYTLRPYAPGDEAAIQEGFSAVFGVRRSLEEWRWKFLGAPRGSRIVLAFDDAGDLVCQYAAIAVDVAWNGELLRAAQIVDVFSRRRRGLGARGGAFQRTMERFLADRAAEPEMGFVYGFPGERHQRAGTVTGHYFEPDVVERLTLTIPGGSPSGGWTPARSWICAQSWICEGYDAHATDRLWRRSRERYRRATVRDAAWFLWRYERRPGGRYLQLGVRRAGEIHAWGVLELDTEAARHRWVDLLWDGERTADLADLAGAIAARAGAAQPSTSSTIDLWLRGDAAARDVLLGLGYSGTPEPLLRLSAIAFLPQVSVPEVLTGYYLTMGDSDHF
jgi:hypothetical protein